MSFLVRDKEFYRRLLIIGLPIAAQQMITVGVNMVDNLMLGQLNETALAASSMATQVHNLFHFMSMGMGMGASVLIARFWGAKDDVSMKKTLVLMYRLCLAVVAIFTALNIATPDGILRLLTPDEEVIAEGVRYLRWAMPCFFFYGLSLTTTIVLRNIGKMRIPLYSSIGAFFLNIFCNWVFIFGKLGAPAMGVAGAALGTLISRMFEFCFICGYFFIIQKKVRFSPLDLGFPAGDLLSEYLRISMPVFISDTLLGLGNSMVMSVAGHIGKAYMSANNITNVTQQLTTVFTIALGQLAVIITGNTLGENDPDKAQQQGVTFAVLGAAIGIICGVLIYAISPAVVSMYQITEETRAMALELMHATAFTTVFMALGSVLTKGVLRGGGDTRFLMVADVVFLWAVSVPLGAGAGLVWHWPPFLIFFCLKIDNLLKSLLCLFRLRSRKWMKKIKGAVPTAAPAK